jgi:hypothetical protein
MQGGSVRARAGGARDQLDVGNLKHNGGCVRADAASDHVGGEIFVISLQTRHGAVSAAG